MSKGFTGLNPGNQAFKQFKCPVLNVLNTAPAMSYGLRFKNPSNEGSIITVA